ncbi:MAG: hypothetical protein K6A61_03220 [Butyrivibrio sp.]|nr:hypothetical protein [Butyrivibrio sp.]
MDVAISRKNITESYDDIMDSYLSSEEYNRKVSDINLLYVALRAELSPDQQKNWILFLPLMIILHTMKPRKLSSEVL